MRSNPNRCPDISALWAAQHEKIADRRGRVSLPRLPVICDLAEPKREHRLASTLDVPQDGWDREAHRRPRLWELREFLSRVPLSAPSKSQPALRDQHLTSVGNARVDWLGNSALRKSPLGLPT